MRSIAHLSDLHLGAPGAAAAFQHCVEQLRREDLVVVTGDLTHRGRAPELALFQRLAAPLIDEGRLVALPGNHDQGSGQVVQHLMGGARVDVVRRAGCSVVRIDSTSPHNKIFFMAHGSLCEQVLAQVDRALEDMPVDHLVIVALHHHVVPLPPETGWEWLSETCRWPLAAELPLGLQLLKVLRGRCDLVLHGHRHVPRQFELDPDSPRPLRVYNAGSTTELNAFRRFTLTGTRAVSEPSWVHTSLAPRPSPHTRPQPLCALQVA